MRDALIKVRGAVSTKDFVPVLTHFCFRDQTVAGFDGRMFIQAPLKGMKLNCSVEAKLFITALDACENDPETIVQNEANLEITRGGFTAQLPIGKAEEFAPATPDPKPVKRETELLPALRRLFPFIGEDASRPWACGALIDGREMFATTNVALARVWIPEPLPGKEPLNLPRFAVEELLRIDEEPISIARSENTLTFYYKDKSWLRSVLFETNWPKPPGELLDGKRIKGHKILPELIEAVKQVVPFADPKNPVLWFDGDEVRTPEGQRYACRKLKSAMALGHGAYRVEPLALVLEAAQQALWIEYPRVRWSGVDIDGLLVGVAR
jgi:DNA polymerase III sliding clamp (beta) subunit (PCNA family)